MGGQEAAQRPFGILELRPNLVLIAHPAPVKLAQEHWHRLGEWTLEGLSTFPTSTRSLQASIRIHDTPRRPHGKQDSSSSSFSFLWPKWAEEEQAVLVPASLNAQAGWPWAGSASWTGFDHLQWASLYAGGDVCSFTSQTWPWSLPGPKAISIIDATCCVSLTSAQCENLC